MQRLIEHRKATEKPWRGSVCLLSLASLSRVLYYTAPTYALPQSMVYLHMMSADFMVSLERKLNPVSSSIVY